MVDLFGKSPTRVVNLHSDGCEVYIGRAGKKQSGYFGNPKSITDAFENREDKIKAFKQYFYHRLALEPEFKKRILELQGKTLGCFCKPKNCHGDIIVEYLNKQ